MSIFCNLIFDANVLTYLYELGLLETCVKAVEHPFTLDLIRDVELKRMPWADVVRREVGVLSLDEKILKLCLRMQSQLSFRVFLQG